jgi:flavodoxin
MRGIMSKGLICYYSKSGTMKIVVEHLAETINTCDFSFYNIANGEPPDLGKYDIVGFATGMNDGEKSHYFEQFLNDLGSYENKDAFLLNVNGSSYGYSLLKIATLVKNHGFKVVSGYSLSQRPKSKAAGTKLIEQELSLFNRYIANLNDFLGGKYLKRFSSAMI